jgi:flagellin
MKQSVSGLRQGSQNGNDGVSLTETASGAMNATVNLLQRMRELASQGSSGTLSSGDLADLNTEYQSLLNEVSRVQATSTFNGIALLSGGSISIQIGENNSSNDRLTITLTATDTTTLAIASSDVTSNANAQTALGLLSTAISSVTTGLATLGASESNIKEAIKSNDARATNLESATSRIMDTDYAQESANLAKFMIMNQANVAMLSQANSSPQLVMQLLS